MFVYAGAKKAELLNRQMSIQFNLQQLAEAQMRISTSLDKVYASATNLEPNSPMVIAGHDRMVQRLFEWQKRVRLTQERLEQEYQMVKAQQETMNKLFDQGVKQFYNMMA